MSSPGLNNDGMRRRVQKTATSEISVVAKAEDGVYKAAGIVKEEAKVVEEIAQRVETFSTTIEEHIDRVEAFVRQVNATLESMEKAVDGAIVALDSSSQPSSSTQVGNLMPKDFLALGWGWNAFRIFLLLLTFSVVILHHWGGLLPYINALEPQSSASSSKTVTFTVFNALLINLGPIVRVVKLIEKAMTGEKKILDKVEEDVDEAAKEVKRTVERVEGVAHIVERVSQQVEQEADHIQGFISQVKSFDVLSLFKILGFMQNNAFNDFNTQLPKPTLNPNIIIYTQP